MDALEEILIDGGHPEKVAEETGFPKAVLEVHRVQNRLCSYIFLQSHAERIRAAVEVHKCGVLKCLATTLPAPRNSYAQSFTSNKTPNEHKRNNTGEMQ